MRVHIRQEEVVLCVLDFLKQAGLARTMRTLEQETGLVVDEYGNDLMFLRGLVLDGQWLHVGTPEAIAPAEAAFAAAQAAPARADG